MHCSALYKAMGSQKAHIRGQEAQLLCEQMGSAQSITNMKPRECFGTPYEHLYHYFWL